MVQSTLNRATVGIYVEPNTRIGRGTFLTNRIILTCRHVIKDFDLSDKSEIQKIYIIYSERYSDPRGVISVWCPNVEKGKENEYENDIAIIELEEPFNVSEKAIDWTRYFPREDKIFHFYGYRADAKDINPEVITTNKCTYHSGRKCYMLQENVCKGFSGGIAVSKIDDAIVAVGLIVARFKKHPPRTWVLPANKIQDALAGSEYRLNFIEDKKETSIYYGLEQYINWLKELRGKNSIDKHFIDVECTAVSSMMCGGSVSAYEFLVDTTQTIGEGKKKKICVLGDYGTGKTCLAIEYCYNQILKLFEKNKNLLPLYIPLRNWEQLPSKDRLLNHVINDYRYPISDLKQLHTLVKEGKIFFVLDGIDELTKKLDPVSAPEIIQKIPGRLPEGASFAILGRTSYFTTENTLSELFEISQDEVPEFLIQKLEDENYQAVKLRPLSPKKIEKCVMLRCEEKTKFVMKLIQDSYGHEDLSSRPVLLNLIIECSEDFHNSIIGKSERISITTASLYYHYVTKRLNEEKVKSKTSIDEKRRFLSTLALYMDEKGMWGVPYEKLLDLLVSHGFGKEDAKLIAYDIANCSFLDRVYDDYEFSHKSFREFFSARGIARKIIEKDPSPDQSITKYLTHVETTNQVISFLREILASKAKSNIEIFDRLFIWLEAENEEDRSNIGHIIGFISKKNNELHALEKLVDAYKKEDHPLPKRSFAIACGHAGREDILESYIRDYLPENPHRQTNLSYHLKYYGSLQHTILAIFNHICSKNYNYLLGIDLFTLHQIIAQESPIVGPDRKLAQVLGSLLSGCDDFEIINSIQKNGVRKFTRTISSIMELRGLGFDD